MVDQPVIHLHRGDLPADVSFGDSVAIDTETMGLNPHRDRLCLVQLSAGDDVCHLVQLTSERPVAPHLVRLLTDDRVLKIFHFARFDLAMIRHRLGVDCRPVWCTKIASKLARTYTDRHGLKDLCRELLGIDIAKTQQTSDWGAAELSEAQLRYAASDVLHLHRLKATLEGLLEREDRLALAQDCFGFLPSRARLDLMGWDEDQVDLFAH